MPFTVPDWILELHRGLEEIGALDPLGTARLIDVDARLRGVAAVRDGLTVSLSRPFQIAEHAPEQSPAVYELQARIRHDDRVVLARDRLIVDNHGYPNTHLDSLNHVGLDGTWHDGSPADVDLPTSYIAGWAQHGLMTRGSARVASRPARGRGSFPAGSTRLSSYIRLRRTDPFRRQRHRRSPGARRSPNSMSLNAGRISVELSVVGDGLLTNCTGMVSSHVDYGTLGGSQVHENGASGHRSLV